jgi:hypothetical protein
MWIATRVAKEFNVLPSVAARDLDEDPERLSMIAVSLLAYSQAKNAYDAANGNEKMLEAWKNSEAMATVRSNTFDLMKERIGHRVKHLKMKVVEPNCRYCQKG